METRKERSIEDYKWTPTDPEDMMPGYDSNTRMVTITMPEGMWEDLEMFARYAAQDGERDFTILSMGGGEAQRFLNEDLLHRYRRVAAHVMQIAEAGTVEYERW